MNQKEFNPLNFSLCFAPYDPRFFSSAWIEHVPFAFALTQMLRPRTFVELGTYAGASYCAFCEAVRQLSLETRCFAVDTWCGDEHAGYYQEEVYQQLRAYHDPRYGAFSQLMRQTFDQAVEKFDNATIDLLHIDGLHTYDAVLHDFQTWLPKMSSAGVVLFHDTSERIADFGVWKCWQELRNQYPGFDFIHGHGLGVLFVGSKMPVAIEMLLATPTQTQQNIRQFYSSLGRRFTQDQSLANCRKDVEDQRSHIQAQRAIIEDQQQYIEAQKVNLEDQQQYIEAQKVNLEDQQQYIEAQKVNLEDQHRYATELTRKIEELSAKAENLQQQHQLEMNSLRESYELSRSWRLTKPLRALSARLSR
ncbi:class I SAM-dependent methyltransferase [Pelovirga terrestris]|uniref:Class I SAM-dependent methyltransferase n=1 Tax=Pelovirga terrestris TaxID=2771352 RepID=A0A8J6QRZ5_9BACT|nr:class I SAM-dependent methyltransferase [Pelovirga terrestris]MBD1401318.1 class I SAM-dependent methyltransferase [Pelovirga terrestris]